MENFSKKFKSLSLITVVALTTTMLSTLFLIPVSAASLTDVTVTLDAETVNTATGVAVNYTVVTAVTANSVFEVTYDTNFTGGASLLDADIATSASGGNLGTCTETDFAAGYFKVTCTGTAATSETVTIDIDGTNDLTTPATAGNYSFSVTADIGGAGTTYDTGAGLAYIADDNDVTVTAYVPPVIDMEIYEQNSATMTNACALGVLSLNQVNTCVYDIAGATNNAAGLTIRVMGVDTSDWTTGEAFLEHSNNTDNIDAVSDGAVTSGSEEYGFQITDDGSSDQYAGGGSYETQNEPVPTSETTLATTTATIDGINTQADRLEITHYASMATDTVVGAYEHGMIYTAYTN